MNHELDDRREPDDTRPMRGAAGSNSGAHAAKYTRVRPLDGPNGGYVNRRWPNNELQHAPRWCSVDLRDGNQALAIPMTAEAKLALYRELVTVGLREIEVGFPAASAPDAEFCRALISDGTAEADGVTIGVLTQCRANLIEATFAALDGAHAATVHFYNSTSALQRRVTFNTDIAGVIGIAVTGAKACVAAAKQSRIGTLTWEYSPESFTDTEPDVAIAVIDAVREVLSVTGAPVIINLPATVECYTPNLYADVVEYISDNLADRDTVTLSVHPHNDRGTAVAATELALLAGADRVEGTLFGNGERTGNVDLVTLAGNLLTDGIDPGIDLSALRRTKDVYSAATGMAVHPRHPYAGELVHTAFSGSHQDAIAKGLADIGDRYDTWEVPYLPVDPAHVDASYEAVIRVNSQSGKGGAAWVLAETGGYQIPRELAAEFSAHVQARTEATEAELDPAALVALFEAIYVVEHTDGRSYAVEARGEHTAVTLDDGRTGSGSGPLEAYLDALDNPATIAAYHTHASGEGSNAAAVCYLQLTATTSSSTSTGPLSVWFVGVHTNPTTSAIIAIDTALEALAGLTAP